MLLFAREREVPRGERLFVGLDQEFPELSQRWLRRGRHSQRAFMIQHIKPAGIVARLHLRHDRDSPAQTGDQIDSISTNRQLA